MKLSLRFVTIVFYLGALLLMTGSTIANLRADSLTQTSLIPVPGPSGLVGGWLFDDGSGVTAVDSSGGGHNATLVNGINWVPGKIGDGVSASMANNQYANIPAIDLSTTQAVTWTAWINRTYSSGAATLIENSANFNSSTTGFGFFPDDSADCGIASNMMTGLHGAMGYALNCYTQPSSGVWHHIAVIYDKSKPGANVISLYIDGILQAPTKQLFTVTNSDTFGNNPIYLFARGGTQQFTSGEMDDLRLYNRGLSASEIEQIYQEGLATLVSLAVTPANISIGKGATQQYVAVGTYSDANTYNLTGLVNWSSSNSSVAAITGIGLATAEAIGNGTVQATLDFVTGFTGVTVTAPSLISITVNPSNLSLGSGATEQYTATGTYSDGSTQNLASIVSWSSSNPAIATVSGSGLTTGVAAGSTTISATVNSVSGSASLTIASGTSVSSGLAGWWQFNDNSGVTAVDSSGNGNNATLVNGVNWVPGKTGDAVQANAANNQYVAIPAINLSSTSAITWSAWINRTYSNGAEALLENSPNFNSSTTGFGFFPDDGADCGTTSSMMTGVRGAVGYTLNCYAQPSSGVWHHFATIYDKTKPGTNVISLYIDGALQTPTKQLLTATNNDAFGNNPTYLFSRGGTQQFTSGEVDDLRLYNRALSASEIAEIYTGSAGTGEVTLQSITITPTGISMAVGGTQQFTATGIYSDGTTQNLSNNVTWTSSNPAIASINSNGVATGIGIGNAVINAASGSVSGSTGPAPASANVSVVSAQPKPVQFVQWTSGDSGAASTSTTYQSHPATSGDLVLVFSHWNNQAVTASVTDQLGNTYLPVFPPTNVGTTDRFQVWYAKNIIGGAPIAATVRYSGTTTSFSVIDVMEYSGLDAANPLDVFASATGIGQSQSTGNMPMTSSNNELIVGLFGFAGYASPYTAGSGFSFRNYDASTVLEDRLVTAPGIYNATVSSSVATSYAAFAMGFRVAQIGSINH